MESSASFVSFTLSRDSSADLSHGAHGGGSSGGPSSFAYTDNTGVNLEHFIVETLHRNYKVSPLSLSLV